MALFKSRGLKQSETEKENEMKKTNKKQNKKREEKRIKKLERMINQVKKSGNEIYLETGNLYKKDMISEIMSKDSKYQCVENGAKIKNGKVKYVVKFTKKEDEDLY